MSCKKNKRSIIIRKKKNNKEFVIVGVSVGLRKGTQQPSFCVSVVVFWL